MLEWKPYLFDSTIDQTLLKSQWIFFCDFPKVGYTNANIDSYINLDGKYRRNRLGW